MKINIFPVGPKYGIIYTRRPHTEVYGEITSFCDIYLLYSMDKHNLLA